MLSNPISGAGRAAAAGESAAAELRAAGHEARTAHTSREPTPQWLDAMLPGIELLVVCGGDGAVRLASGAAVRTQTPIYHLPFGTENLFAREFGMNRNIASLLTAIEKWTIRNADIGSANGEPFVLMASVGFDAEVVHHVAACRGASISHWTYLGPIWTQLKKWRPSCLQVIVDGEPIGNPAGQTGFVVIANSRQYGWRLNPAGRASMFDGQLDVAFFPARSRLDVIRWALKARFQRHLVDPSLIYRLGRRVEVKCASNCRYQLDGDPAGIGDSTERCDGAGAEGVSEHACLHLTAEITPAALPVLIP